MSDHERTVADARSNMGAFDAKSALERWLQNYVHPGLGIPSGYWCTVAPIPDKAPLRYVVEWGPIDESCGIAFVLAEAGAPEPPVFEFRPPAPSLPKARWRVPPAPAVPGLEQKLRGSMDAALPHQLMTCTAIANDKGITLEDLLKAADSIEEFERDYRMNGVRVAIRPDVQFQPDDTAVSRSSVRTVLLEDRDIFEAKRSAQWLRSLGVEHFDRMGIALALTLYELRLKAAMIVPMAPVPVEASELPSELQRPAPAPTKRNQ